MDPSSTGIAMNSFLSFSGVCFKEVPDQNVWAHHRVWSTESKGNSVEIIATGCTHDEIVVSCDSDVHHGKAVKSELRVEVLVFPRENGFDIIERLLDCLTGFEHGVRDYESRPFAISELGFLLELVVIKVVLGMRLAQYRRRLVSARAKKLRCSAAV